MAAQHESDVVPVRMTIHVTTTMTRAEYDEGTHFDRVSEALEAQGLLGEGGASSVMDEADVIADSPLAKRLADERKTTR